MTAKDDPNISCRHWWQKWAGPKNPSGVTTSPSLDKGEEYFETEKLMVDFDYMVDH